MALMETCQAMNSFLSPAILFLLLNLVIATIVLSSRQCSGDPASSSFAAPLFRTTSPVLDRLKSFTLRRFRSGEVPSYPNSPNYNHDYTPSGLSTELGPDLSIESSSRTLDDAFRAVESSHTTISNLSPSPPPTIARTSSVLYRIKSINLPLFRSGEIQPQQVQAENYIEPNHHKRNQSEPSSSSSRLAAVDSDVAKSEKKKKTKKAVSRTAGEGAELSVRRGRKPAPAMVVEEEVDLDARADDFISKFKENLKIQRLNSILNFTEMLNRGR